MEEIPKDDPSESNKPGNSEDNNIPGPTPRDPNYGIMPLDILDPGFTLKPNEENNNKDNTSNGNTSGGSNLLLPFLDPVDGKKD
jgi:hypothetical protein